MENSFIDIATTWSLPLYRNSSSCPVGHLLFPPPFLPALCKSALVFVILVPCLTNPSELLCSQSAIVEQPTLWVSMPLPFQGQATWSSVVWCHWKIAGGRQGRKDTSMQLLGPCERISGGRVRPPHCYLALADVESDQPIKVTLASCLNA